MENTKFSAQGIPQWFSPRHAGEKFNEIGDGLEILLAAAKKSKQRSLATKIRALEELAKKYADYFLAQSPVQSVRIMHPSGAIFVILQDGREVMIPQG
jgi:hypothetical protein